MQQESIDLKSLAVLSKQQVELSAVLMKVDMATGEKQDWINLLKFEPQEECYLKNWLRYRICTKLQLYDNQYFDCDATDVAKEYCVQKVRQIMPQIDEATILVHKKSRYISICDENLLQPIILETDTKNSMGTLFNQFMRNFFKKKYGERWYTVTYGKEFKLSKYDYKSGDAYRDIYFWLHIEELILEMSEEEKEIINQFQIFSRLTHTLPNITLVPYGFNTERSTLFSDFWDLTVRNFWYKKTHKYFGNASFTWYLRYLEYFAPEAEGELYYEGHSAVSPIPEDNLSILRCVQEINNRLSSYKYEEKR